MKIGVLGVTFDPIHLGHLMIAEEGRLRLGLKRVLFIPAGQPWLKADRQITAAKHRLEMVRLAIAGNPHFEVSSIEIERPGPSYTVYTLRELKQQSGWEASLFLLVGWDSLGELLLWKEPHELLQLCRIVAFPRPGYNKPDLADLEKSLPGIMQNVIWLDVAPVDISSTDIRARVAQKLPVNHLVPQAVAQYIEEQKLYL